MYNDGMLEYAVAVMIRRS